MNLVFSSILCLIGAKNNSRALMFVERISVVVCMIIANFIVIGLQITKVTDEGRLHPLSWPYQNPKSLALLGSRNFQN